MKEASQIKVKKKLAWVYLDYFNTKWTSYVFPNPEEEKICMESFQYVVCISQYILRSIKTIIGNVNNLVVRYNPINVQNIIEHSRQDIDCYHLDKDKCIFVAIGRLDEQKGYDRLLECCTKLYKFKLSYSVYILGEGTEKDNLICTGLRFKQLLKKKRL